MRGSMGMGAVAVALAGCTIDVGLVGTNPPDEPVPSETETPEDAVDPLVSETDLPEAEPFPGCSAFPETKREIGIFRWHLDGETWEPRQLIPWKLSGADLGEDLPYLPWGPDAEPDLVWTPGLTTWYAALGNPLIVVHYDGADVSWSRSWTDSVDESTLGLAACDPNGDNTDELALVQPQDLGWLFQLEQMDSAEIELPDVPSDATGFGETLACGDLDSDGRDEILISADAQIFVYTGVPATQIDVLETSHPTTAMSPVGDADGDGRGDLAFADDHGGLFRWDGVTVIPLSDGEERVPQGVGDVNGDGYDDLVLSTAHADPAVVELRLGAPDASAWTTTVWDLEVAATALAPRVRILSDQDGDGYGEIVVSTVTETDGHAGRVELYHGSETGVGALVASCEGSRGSELGVGLENLGDLDLDGRDELGVTHRSADEYSVAIYSFPEEP